MRQPTRSVSSYAVREVRDTTRDEWDGWLRDSPGGGHVYQSHAWGEFKRRLGWKPVRLVLERDGEVAGAGQFLAYHTDPIPGVLMYCTKGPWLPWDDAEVVRAFFDGVREVAKARAAHTVKIEPEVPEEREDVKALLDGIGFKKARYDLQQKTTLVVDLSPSEEEVMANMKRKTRNNVRRSEKKGVEVVEAVGPEFEEAFETFYEFMEVTSERNEFGLRRSRDYLHGVTRTMQEADQGRLFLTVHEGQPLSAAYFFSFGGKIWYIYGASSNEKRNLLPNYRMQWEAIRWAKRRGATYYDMVGMPRLENLNEDDSLWGVYQFKAGFGGEIRDFLGCLDLPVRPALAAAWYKFEPLYYRLYYKLKGDVFY